MDSTDIEAKLQARVEDVCRHLLPNGHREGNEWVVGNLAGEAGKSLKINLAGKVGVWCDFADGGKGGKTLMSLWCSVRQREFRFCIKEAKDFLGIRDGFQNPSVTNYPAPPVKPDESTWRKVSDTWAKCSPLVEGGPVWRYLVDQRGLDPQAIAAFDIRESISFSEWTMVFPYWAAPVDDLAAVEITPPVPEWLKFEKLARVEGKKKEWTSSRPEKSLFGVQLSKHPAFRTCRDVLICEGEKDGVAWASYGCAAWGILPVSVPFGAKWKGQNKGLPSPNREWLDRNWEWLQGFQTVYVAMDNDEPGKRAAADIIAEIGPRRCRLVELPNKDANDCLVAGVSAEAMQACLAGARDFAPDKVKNAGEFEAELIDEWLNKHLDTGLLLPLDFPDFSIRPAELTIWTGIEKSGKTTMLGFCLMALMAQGERAMVCSLETKARKTLKKFSRQASGVLLYDRKIVDQCRSGEELNNYRASATEKIKETSRWLAKNLWLYDHTGIAQWRMLIDDVRWARRRHGITQFVIDNFMRLGFVKDDYAQQAECITALSALAMELEVHIHLVVHQNKSEGHKGQASGKRSISGAFEIIANAHNIVEVQRDVNKGEKVSEVFQDHKIGRINDQERAERLNGLNGVPDGKFILHAQREGEQQNASRYLWFLWECQQYVSHPKGHTDHKPLRFVDAAATADRQAADRELPTSEEMDL